jgi:serine/threonine protein kinase/type II secretory pathway pseudopilin PulG
MKTCPVCDTDYPDQHTNCPTDGAVLIVSHELAPGSLVRGKYRIVRKLGQGGMGVVYLADDTLLGVRVALKFLAGDLGKDPKFIKRFRNEARAAYQLRHPNIVEVTSLDQADDGSLFISMEFVEGPSLRTVLEEARREPAQARGGLAIPRALEIARGIASGLAAAHALGTVHRDIKPENILLTRPAHGPERPKILDFGIVAMAESATRLSLTRGLLLTPEYAAPEQWREMPSAEMDGRTDLYALGCVLYELLTGRTPFHSHNTSGWLQQHLEAIPAPPSQLRPEINAWPGLDALVLRLLAKDREQRPASAAEFLAELDRIEPMPEPMPHTPPQARPQTVVEMPTQPDLPARTSAEQIATINAETRTVAATVAAEMQIPTPRRNTRKLILILVIVAVVLFFLVALILAALVIPSLLSSRVAANEASAIAIIRNINTAEIQYDSTYGRGFACSLATLGGDPKAGQATQDAAQLLPPDVSSGIKSGYVFTISNCTKATAGNAAIATGYKVTAVPQIVGKTGKRGFCSDASGVTMVDPSGGTNCTQPVQ